VGYEFQMNYCNHYRPTSNPLHE